MIHHIPRGFLPLISLCLALLSIPLNAPAANLTGLSLTPANPKLGIGQKLGMTATGSFDDGIQRVLKQAVSVDSGSSHSCAVATNGTVWCWGYNATGQLGNGTRLDSATPVNVKGINSAVSVAAGGEHACALLADGSVRCWGANRGRLGNGKFIAATTPVAVSGISTAIAVSAGALHTCAVLANGTVSCWGLNNWYQLGNGTNTNALTPITVSGISNTTAVSAGSGHTCALLADGTVSCWGTNSYGELGDGTTNDTRIPVPVSGIGTAVAITTGDAHTCAVLADGALRCWGLNSSGQLGNGAITDDPISTPVTVNAVNTAVSVNAGGLNTCAVLVDGALRCWGDNDNGMLGNGIIALDDSPVPVTVSGIDNAVTVSIGGAHTCARLSDGTVSCWGDNDSGSLGIGIVTDVSTPAPVNGINSATGVSGNYSHSCAVLSDGTVRCWGSNHAGQLGNDSVYLSATPVTVTGISTAVKVSAGDSFACAVLSTGSVSCWGFNESGALGNGTTTGTSTPVPVSGISTAVSVASGAAHSCALLANGTIRCWGANWLGQLGNGISTYDPTSIPVTVATINNAVAISAGHAHTCAVLADGTVHCWGYNSLGQLGDGTFSDTTPYTTPVIVSGIGNAVSVSAGGEHTCALLDDGTIRCWGANWSGQLGNGKDTNSLTPDTVSGISSAKAVSAGYSHTCAVLADGTISCWGANYYAQLGNGTIHHYPTNLPGEVSDISTAVSVNGGSDHTCAVLADNTLRCWGNNYYGQIGNGRSAFFTSPVSLDDFQPLAWSSGDDGIATVNNGRVTGVAVGATNIAVNSGSFSANTTVTVNNFSVDLSLSMSGSKDPLLVGETLIYTLTVANNGPDSAHQVTLTDTLPANVAVISIVPNKGTCSGKARVRCWLGSLRSGATASVVITVYPTATGLLNNLAVVQAAEVDPDSSNNSASASALVQ